MAEVSSISELVATIQQAVVPSLQPRTRAAARELQRLLVENAPFDEDDLNRKRDEHLRDLIRVETSSDESGTEVRVFMPDYWRFTEFGTRPHVINPREEDGVLSFFVAAERVFAQQVQHPGSEAQGWVQASLDEWRPLLLEELAKLRFDDLSSQSYTIDLRS